jgi:hypothetical protein
LEKLVELIKSLTPKNTNEAVKTITGMVCSDELYCPLSEGALCDALSIKGEYLVIKMCYEDFSKEFLTNNLKYKVSQALSVIVSFEDDGSCFENIEEFTTYISDIIDTKQNTLFGVKKVKKLSKYPVTILFSGILSINQLKMYIGSAIDSTIKSDEEYFQHRFKEFRDFVSQEIKMPILPLFPQLKTSLNPTEVILVDIIDERIIVQFQTKKSLNKDVIDEYLIKLFHLYISLAK